MLLFEFENFDKLPELITGKILETEKETVTEEIRKYFKYLSYIPLGADIFFIEVDLSNIVSKKTMKHFGKELAIRKSKRNKKLEMERIANEEFEKKKKEMNEKKLYDTVKFQVSEFFVSRKKYEKDDFPTIKESKEDFIKDTITEFKPIPEGDWNKKAPSTKKKKKKEEFPTFGGSTSGTNKNTITINTKPIVNNAWGSPNPKK
jgi:hypothetical protein